MINHTFKTSPRVPRFFFQSKDSTRFISFLSIILVIYCLLSVPLGADESLKTIPEKTNYNATSTFADVQNFFTKLDHKYPGYLHMSVIGKSNENRDILMVTLSDPPPHSPADNKKPVILINANIHAGEVEGKEAVQMLARDILKDTKKRKHLLKTFTILLIPVFNVDGNEKISPDNRPYQQIKGGVGTRANSMNMDMNRDFVKMDSPEVRALVQTFDDWDPFLVVDCHTTNGSLHVEELTYMWSNSPAGSREIHDYTYKEIMPFIKKYTLEKHGIRTIPYGNFDDQLKPTSWGGMGKPSIMYGVNYFGAKGVFSILDENYAYADFPARVRACYSLLDGLIQFSLNNKKEMLSLIKRSRQEPAVICQNISVKPFPEKITIMGYEVEKTDSPIYHKRYRNTGRRVDYTIDFVRDITADCQTVTGAYVFPPGLAPIREKLKQHGIFFYSLPEDITTEAAIYSISSIKYKDLPFQGRIMVDKLEGAYKTEAMTIKKGWTVVPLDNRQKYRRLVPLLLEPESMDSLLRYGFFNTLIFPNQWNPKPDKYPVYRIALPKETEK